MKITGLVAVMVAAVDQLIKLLVRRIPEEKTLFILPGILSIECCVNTGAAFSMLSGHTVLIAVISLILLAGIMVYGRKKLRLSRFSRIMLEFLIGGGVGNLIDRLLFAGVTDYIRLLFIDFPVFNLADIAITGSISALLVLLITDTLEVPLEDQGGSNY